MYVRKSTMKDRFERPKQLDPQWPQIGKTGLRRKGLSIRQLSHRVEQDGDPLPCHGILLSDLALTWQDFGPKTANEPVCLFHQP